VSASHVCTLKIWVTGIEKQIFNNFLKEYSLFTESLLIEGYNISKSYYIVGISEFKDCKK